MNKNFIAQYTRNEECPSSYDDEVSFCDNLVELAGLPANKARGVLKALQSVTGLQWATIEYGVRGSLYVTLQNKYGKAFFVKVSNRGGIGDTIELE